jgi:integrase
MKIMGLTDLQIQKLKKRAKKYEISDGKGLSIRVYPTGDKAWFFRYMFERVPRMMTLGAYPGTSLADARTRHGQAMLDVQQGADPGLKAKEAKAKRKAAPTFQDLLDEYFEEELGKTPSGDERKRLVDKDAIPTWKKRKVSSITRRDAVLLLDKVRKRAPVTANRLQGVMIRMFNFASERGIIDFSPLAGMRRGKESSRSRVLTDAEIKTLWNCLDMERTDFDMYRLNKLALKAILLTGQRPGEVAGMAKDDIDDEWWTIPAGQTKNREENRVPVLPMLSDVIEQAKIYSSDSQYIFRSSHDKERPLTVGALANAIRRHSAEMGINERFTPHDLRRTLRTRLAEIGVTDIVAERVLGHKLQGVLGIYNRHSYDAEKRQALARWEQRLCEILGLSESASNVIQLNEVRHG